MKRHAELAREVWQNEEKAKWQNSSLWFFRKNRDNAAKSTKNFEELRELANQVKLHTLSNLGNYLKEFEQNAKAKGIVVHWAKNAKECNEIVSKIALENNVKKVVKSKSMLTEETHLNAHLESQNIEVVETDLGEKIIQFRKEMPSHIVVPAIHLKKEEVGETFHKHINTPKGESDPEFLTHAARAHLRDKFLNADMGISGVNFAVADKGEIVVCTNEGNADLTMGLPKVHVAVMGIEKVVPNTETLSVFTSLLAKSATGQKITVYTSHISKPKKDGSMHIVIVDNKRSALLGQNTLLEALKCIRCGACLNTCPVFRRSGGHSYNYIIPGPIGSALAPFYDFKKYHDMAYACTLCKSCACVCPAKVPLDNILFQHRQQAQKLKTLSIKERFLLKIAYFAMVNPWLLKVLNMAMITAYKVLPKFISENKKLNKWAIYHSMPKLNKTFDQLLKEEKLKAKKEQNV